MAPNQLTSERGGEMNKTPSVPRKFWNNFEEYMCAIALVIMTIVTFINVLSRKLPSLNLAFTQEIVTTMFVWVCCLAAAAAFKTDSHMGFSYFTDKLKGQTKVIHKILRIAICFSCYGIWLIYGLRMTISQFNLNLLTPVMQMPGWLIGIAVPLSAVLSMVRLFQYEFKKGDESA